MTTYMYCMKLDSAGYHGSQVNYSLVVCYEGGFNTHLVTTFSQQHCIRIVHCFASYISLAFQHNDRHNSPAVKLSFGLLMLVIALPVVIVSFFAVKICKCILTLIDSNVYEAKCMNIIILGNTTMLIGNIIIQLPCYMFLCVHTPVCIYMYGLNNHLPNFQLRL